MSRLVARRHGRSDADGFSSLPRFAAHRARHLVAGLESRLVSFVRRR